MVLTFLVILLHSIKKREFFIVLTLVVFTVILGIYPSIVLDSIHYSIYCILYTYDIYVDNISVLCVDGSSQSLTDIDTSTSGNIDPVIKDAPTTPENFDDKGKGTASTIIENKSSSTWDRKPIIRQLTGVKEVAEKAQEVAEAKGLPPLNKTIAEDMQQMIEMLQDPNLKYGFSFPENQPGYAGPPLPLDQRPATLELEVRGFLNAHMIKNEKLFAVASSMVKN